MSNWHWKNKRKLWQFRCHELSSDSLCSCPLLLLMSDWFQATGQLPYLQHFNPSPSPPPHSVCLYIPASLYQSFSLRVLDVVMDHQKKYPCQTRTKNNVRRKKRQYIKFVFSCMFWKPSNNLWVFCDRFWLNAFICFKGLSMYLSASIDRVASFDLKSAGFF
jgi:hypothetical protein